MGFLATTDGQYYRRWVSVGISLFIPGVGHYLSGRKKAGIAWFIVMLFVGIGVTWLEIGPPEGMSQSVINALVVGSWVLFLVMLVDVCRRPAKKAGAAFWIGLASVILILGLGLPFLIRGLFMQPFKIPTGAMMPTLLGIQTLPDGKKTMGDHILVNKWCYRNGDPQRGDIVVFKTNQVEYPGVKKGQYYIKRIVGIPGDRVSIQPPHVMIDGQPLVDPPIFEKIASKQDGYDGYHLARAGGMHSLLAQSADTITLNENEYLMMGDNSASSLDGRYFGPVQRDQIVGKAFYIYGPKGRTGKI